MVSQYQVDVARRGRGSFWAHQISATSGNCQTERGNPNSKLIRDKSHGESVGGLIANHRRWTAEFAADKLQHLVNRIGNRAGAAAGVQQADRPRVGGGVFDKQRAGIARIQE